MTYIKEKTVIFRSVLRVFKVLLNIDSTVIINLDVNV